MADTTQRVEYFYLHVPNKAGEGSRFLTALHEAGINLLAFSGFPEGRGSQLDFVPADPAAPVATAPSCGWPRATLARPPSSWPPRRPDGRRRAGARPSFPRRTGCP